MFPELHGGTMRYLLTPGDTKTHVKTSVTGLRVLESALFQQDLTPYQEFARTVQTHLGQMRTQLTTAAGAGQRIWGYGANAKSAVLLQAAGLSEATIECLVDDTSAKHGLRSPGMHLPIIAATDLSAPDILVLFSWNNAAELQTKAQARGFRGRFFLPHPEPHFA